MLAAAIAQRVAQPALRALATPPASALCRLPQCCRWMTSLSDRLETLEYRLKEDKGLAEENYRVSETNKIKAATMLWEPIGQEQRAIMNAIRQNTRDLDWQGALAALDHIPASPGPEWVPVFRSVLQCCCKAARYEEAHQVWSRLPQRDIMSFNTMINLCGRLRKTEEAQQLLAQMQAEGIQPTGITLVTMIKVHSETSDYDAALRCFDELKRSGLEFSGELAYLHVLKACERGGQAHLAREMFDELKAGVAIPQARPQVMHYNVLLHAHREEPLKAKAVFEEMRAGGFATRPRDWRALMLCFRHDFEEVERLYQEMKQTLGPLADEDVFEAMLTSARFCNDAAAARRVLEEMRSVGLPPDLAKLPALRRALSMVDHITGASDSPTSSFDRRSMPTPPMPPEPTGPPPLPTGWGTAQDPNSGLDYFWRIDDPANSTTWVRPTA